MTQEQKDLLLKDLCARLPYGVKFKINETYLTEDMIKGKYDKTQELYGITCEGNVELLNMDYHMPIESVKPYLFPMSSMTKEQESYLYFNTKFRIDMFGDLVVRVAEDDNYCYTDIIDYASLIDWLNKNHFDYRGLIEKGLAIDATGKNIY
jgi:hypothetical protein